MPTPAQVREYPGHGCECCLGTAAAPPRVVASRMSCSGPPWALSPLLKPQRQRGAGGQRKGSELFPLGQGPAGHEGPHPGAGCPAGILDLSSDPQRALSSRHLGGLAGACGGHKGLSEPL